jgi:hypothetical protein
MKNLLNTLREVIKNNNLNEDEVLNAIFINSNFKINKNNNKYEFITSEFTILNINTLYEVCECILDYYDFIDQDFNEDCEIILH